MKIFQVFESYPLFYQPYIPPVIMELQKQKELDVKIIAFKGEVGDNNEATVLPSYKGRKVIAKISQRLRQKYRNLDYFEIKLLKEKVDIVHLQHSFLYPKILNLLKLPKESRPKIIITLRGGDTYVKPWLSDRWRKFYKNYGEKVDAFIVMSEDQKKYLFRWGVPLNNIHIIPISFGKKFPAQPKTANEHQMRLVSVFRMCWEKNVTDSLRFVGALKQKGIQIVYDVYGDGPDLGQLYFLRDKYDLNDEVNILGKVSNEELKKNLISYDFILQLSHSESLGMSVIEAQSTGIPAIVSNNGGLPEIISGGESGFIVDLENLDDSIQKVITAWTSPTIYNQMSQKAIDGAQQNFSLENEVGRLINLYSTLH